MAQAATSIDILKREGIIENDENVETVYLTEEETNRFMEKYMLENPDVEVETRYLKPAESVVQVQEIQVRWLLPDEPIEVIEKKKPTRVNRAS